MSKNDGGDPLVLHRTPVKKPVIPRGVMKVVIDPTEEATFIRDDDPVTFTKRLTDGEGRAFLATYHGARLVGVSLGGDDGRGPPRTRRDLGGPVTWRG